jgi:hypothetical protein
LSKGKHAVDAAHNKSMKLMIELMKMMESMKSIKSANKIYESKKIVWVESVITCQSTHIMMQVPGGHKSPANTNQENFSFSVTLIFELLRLHACVAIVSQNKQ